MLRRCNPRNHRRLVYRANLAAAAGTLDTGLGIVYSRHSSPRLPEVVFTMGSPVTDLASALPR